ncbi:MAG: FAD-dependent monooxygenase [Deinococcus sp.]|nr:FAD-dependent monooxygenase [Deinococcus sp.]
MDQYDLVIVGGGPAGLSTALSLERLAQRRLLERTLVLERETYPRVKLCGGGVTRAADAYLARLGLHIDVPSIPIHAVRFQYAGRSFTVHSPNLLRVVRREEFDAVLADAAQQRGLQIKAGVAVTGVRRHNGAIKLETNQGTLRARAVVAADGANSTVRQKLGFNQPPHRLSRLIEILTPEDPATTPAFTDHLAVFDLNCVSQGIQGYVWDFPSLLNGQVYMNRGIFDSRVHAQIRGNLRQALDKALQARGCELGNYSLMGHPERWFDPSASFAAPRVLLVGDAAGVDPLFGEGISYALRYGGIAAQELTTAFVHDDFSFRGYRQHLLHSPLGRELILRTHLARLAYGPFRHRWALRLCWALGEGLVNCYLNWRVRQQRTLAPQRQ